MHHPHVKDLVQGEYQCACESEACDRCWCSNNCEFYFFSGSSSECPSGLACFPNTPCAKDPSATLKPLATISPILSQKPETKFPTGLPTPSPTQTLLEMKATSAPATSTQSIGDMPSYCGLDVESIDCSLPCSSGDECPLEHDCYATQVCSNSFYCGETFAAANATCSHACADGRDKSCPGGMRCYAKTSCADRSHTPPEITSNEGYFYCGKDFADASTSCPLACPSGSSSECNELGPEYSCFSSTPCGDKVSYYCGTTWSHAASNCLFPCSSGLDSECPDETFCFPYTSCDKIESFMCGTSFEDASSCKRACPSGSSSECAFGESCFTRTTCRVEDSSPQESPKEVSLPESFFCGTSFADATSSCKHACPR